MAYYQSMHGLPHEPTTQYQPLPLSISAVGYVPCPPPDSVPRRRRKSAPKTKKGCTTCKQRHIRCDEERPGCKRCKKIGVECGGYTDLDPRTARPKRRRAVAPASKAKSAPKAPIRDSVSSSSTAYSTLSPSPSASSIDEPGKLCVREPSNFPPDRNEGRGSEATPMHPGPAVGAIGPNEVDYLHYFREHAATTLSGPDNSTFWANVLCTASQKEPSIRYAIVALSSIHRHYAVSSEPTSSPDIALIKPQVTLTYYNAAISALSDITSAGPYSFVTSLMCCVIFIALETIQGNDAAVANHARSRQSVIRQWKTERHNGRRSSASMADYNDYCLVEQHIAPLVEQAAALTGCFQETGLGEVGSYLPDPGNYISFGSLLEAARALNDLGEVAVACNGPDAVAKLPGTGAIRDPPHIQQLQRQLRAWKVAYNDLHACMQAALATDARQASLADVLATNFYAIFVWLSSALAPDQSGFSEHYQTFQEITQFAPPIPTTSPPNHSWSESTMQQYVFAAFFCRDLQIRRQALRLLRRSLKGEAFPNLVLTLPICDRMAVSKIDTTSADPALDRYAVDFGHPQAEGASSGLGSIHQQLLHESSDHSNHDSRSPITACIPSLDITAPSLAPDYTPTHFAAQSSQDVIPYQSNFEVLDSLVQPATLSDSWCPQIAHGGFGETYLAAMFTSD